MPKLILGLTGGVASGKTLVLREFARLGAETIDCDALARRAVQKGRPAWRAVVRRFGRKILLSSGALDRAALGRIVFRNPARRKILERIIHPKVRKEVSKKIAASKKRLIVVDVPLLFEADWRNLVDKTLVVWASVADQLGRVMKRNRLSRSEALRRIRSQWPLARKKRLADFVIDNSGSPARTCRDVQMLFKKLIDKLAEL